MKKNLVVSEALHERLWEYANKKELPINKTAAIFLDYCLDNLDIEIKSVVKFRKPYANTEVEG